MSPPVIEFSCNCYHMKKMKKVVKNRQGTYHKDIKVKKESYSEVFKMPLFSSRDVSGLFMLNSNAKDISKKLFVKLELENEINFADDVSYMDYIYQKEQFWRRNRFRDYYMDFSEKRYIPGLSQYNLIRIGAGSNPKCLNLFWFLFFTIISFGQIYKI